MVLLGLADDSGVRPSAFDEQATDVVEDGEDHRNGEHARAVGVDRQHQGGETADADVHDAEQRCAEATHGTVGADAHDVPERPNRIANTRTSPIAASPFQ